MPQTPNPTYYDRVRLSNNTYSFRFNSLEDIDRFIDDAKRTSLGNARTVLNENINTKISNRLRQVTGNNWFGSRDVARISDTSNYMYANELPNLLSNFNNNISSVNFSDLDQTKAIKFTEKEIGVFSFDLASLGLIPVYEYYSKLLNRIVDANYVESVLLKNGRREYYHVNLPYIKEHRCNYNIKQGGFYSDILQLVIPKELLVHVQTANDDYYVYPERQEIKRHQVEKIQKLDKNGKKKWTTTFKKSFIEIPKVEKPLPRIDIIVPVAYNVSNSSEEIKYNSLALIKLVENLSNIGINVRVIASYSVGDMFSTRNPIFSYITIKKEDEPLDKNKMGILLSDARYYRVKRFDLITSMYSDTNREDVTNGAWSTITDATTIKNNYIEFLAQQSNPSDILASQNPNSKIVTTPVTTLQDAIDTYTNLINQIRRV
jgi:hypothetical protein